MRRADSRTIRNLRSTGAHARRPNRPARLGLSVLVTLSLVGGLLSIATQASAVGSVTVSLTFDDNTSSEYTQAYLQALQPHNVHATFFVKSGSVGAGGSNMTWTQVTTLAGGGNDIGGKTVSATNLVGDPNAATQVCQDRLNLISHGLTPIAFAYPGGTGFNDATVRGVVQSCGYGNARRAGGLSPTSSTNFAETLPPVDPLAIRVYLPPSPAGGVQLTDLQAIVNNAYTRGGGWVPVVLPSKVCPTQADPGYAACATGTFVGVDVLNQFLTWVQNAGQVNQAPGGTSFDTAAHVLTTSDTSTPTTGITCNGSACSGDPYPGVVSVTLPATDLGSGIASTHYTTDGSDPTLSSPTYAGAFNVNGSTSSTTVKFRSWDYAGNVEATKTQVVNAPSDTTPPTTTIACNGSPCNGSQYVDSVTVTLSATDAGGSGVNKTYYTTDGSTPTTSSTVYSSAFQLTQSATVTFFSTDIAGNAEVVQSQPLQVVPHATIVSLTFDNGTVGQYTLAYQQALQPHNAHATFFVNSGNVGGSAQIMTWNQLSALAAAGNDIGGKTVSATNLTTDPDPTTQVCQDRQNLISNGLNPVAFAYPGGAFNTTTKNIVQSCGYGNARSAGSLSPNGPTYAETLPPKDWLATRAYPGNGSPSTVTLADMESLVTGAASHGGGWVQIVMTRVCSQSLDPTNYPACTAASGHVELTDLISFLDWVQGAGQPSGAPAGTTMQTVRDVVTAADASAPTTGSSCDVGPCTGSYNSVVKVTLSPSDLGTGVSSTRFTLDGTAPTLASPTYTRPIAITSPTVLSFRSWDNAGNVEATRSLSIQATPPPDGTPPTTTISCDNAPCTSDTYTGLVTVKLIGDDGSGWGIDQTFFTTDGSTPTASSSVYSGPFQLSAPAAHTVKFFSVDLAGNAEQVQTQQIAVGPARTLISLTFDDGDQSQFALAFQRSLQPHGLPGTFYINTGNLASGPGFMTWSNLTTLAANGDEVAGHTTHHIDLTSSSYTQQQKIDEVCNDRQALVAHGLSPTSFAYPFGAYDANAETIVQDCGYTSARRTGGLPSAGPPYAETLPPTDPFATLTWTAPTPTDTPIQLSDMQAAVANAASHGGGWVQFVFHQVCSQTYDPSNYSACLGSFRPTELATFDAFVDWLKNAGQPGGAPIGTEVRTVGYAVDGPDTQPPTTALLCDGATCQATSYNGSVTVSLSATDQGGSGVSRTYYTTDGSTPTTSSPVYTLPFTTDQAMTVKFFSVDNAGNTEPANTQQVQVQPNPDPIIGAAGDIACDPAQLAFNGGQGTATDCRAAHTAQLLTGVDAVLPLGDNQYQCGGTAAYQQSYDPTWGVKKSISHPVPGDHDYLTSGGTDCPSTPGAGYYQYFGARAGDPSKGYYSYDLGSWHIIGLNTGPCPNSPSFCGPGSAQIQWLQQDLAANSSAQCTLAYYQSPRWVSDDSGGSLTYQEIWHDLYAAGVDVVLSGDSHWYERFQMMDASGDPDPIFGMREFVVGTGGQGLETPAAQLATSQVLNNTTHGVIKLTLHNGSYDWAFVPDETAFTDSGNGNCHGAPAGPDTVAPTTTISCNGGPCDSSPYAAPVNVALASTDAGGTGVDKTYYTTDGSAPTTSSAIYTGPFPLSQTTTVRFFSTDIAGNAETAQSKQVNIQAPDTTPPATTIACNATPCSTGWYTSAPVSVSLSANDAGSGVDKTYYTIDGSTPTTSSTIYTGAFGVSQTTSVKFFSRDNAGNAEQVRSQLIQIDGVAPVTTFVCNGASCGSGAFNKGPVKITLPASDSGGSGLDKTYYTTDGSTPTTSSTVYVGQFSLTKTTTIRSFSTDKAGNAEPPKSQQVTIDSAAPTTAISCNAAACSSGWYTASSVLLSLFPSDTGGSGVAKTYYTTDGSTPTTASPVYAGAFTIAQTTTVKFFSVDNAGNKESVKTSTARLDAVAPSISVTAPTNGQTFKKGAKVSLSATSSDAGTGTGAPSGVAKVVFYLDSDILSTDTSSPFTATWSTSRATVGTHTITAVATDAAGNSTTSSVINVTITN